MPLQLSGESNKIYIRINLMNTLYSVHMHCTTLASLLSPNQNINMYNLHITYIVQKWYTITKGSNKKTINRITLVLGNPILERLSLYKCIRINLQWINNFLSTSFRWCYCVIFCFWSSKYRTMTSTFLGLNQKP